MKILNGIGAHGILSNELNVQVYKFKNTHGSLSKNCVIETHMATVMFEVAKEIDATATVAATVGDSSTYSGTKTLTYAVASGKTLEVLVIGTTGSYNDYTEAAVDTTFDSNEVY